MAQYTIVLFPDFLNATRHYIETMSEADTCRTYVVPRLYSAGWTDEQIKEQVSFTAGRIIPTGNSHTRRPGKRADYILRYRLDFPIAVVEAKAGYRNPSDGLQQAMDYAELLQLRFAYATNGHGIVEHDYLTGSERMLDAFPSPEELWGRLQGMLQLPHADDSEDLLFPFYTSIGGKQPRYYQEIAINRAVEAVLKGQKRILLTMATGTGKTFVAFQIVWKLWKTRRRTRILYLADRNVLVDQAKDRDFAPLGDAATKIQGRVVKSREVYFAIYQAIADREGAPGLYHKYPPDFFDLVIVDECHRGSADEQGSWRAILAYFNTATQIGMTATPKRSDNVDTYAYFGDPIYTYSLKTGIDDGFLAPYRVIRVVPSVDALGWRPEPGERDRFGREIPDGLYGTKEFERIVSLLSRTEMVAAHLTRHLRETDPMAKTIVFCVDQEHAADMRLALVKENRKLVRQYPNYVARVVSDEKKIGRGHLDNFQDPEKATPVILTTSQMLTTGVDVPTCRNIVLFKPIGSMTEFKQIIGRGSRVREDFGKYWFTIIDYTGATGLFADPTFDGDPIGRTEQTIDPSGYVVESSVEVGGTDAAPADAPPMDGQASGTTTEAAAGTGLPPYKAGEEPRKFYVDQTPMWIMGEQVYELDPDGHILRTVQFVDYSRDQVRRLAPTADHLLALWPIAERRAEVVDELRKRGIDLDYLATLTHQSEADPLDVLLHVAWNAPGLTRRERAAQLRSQNETFFNTFTRAAREVLSLIVDKYADYGWQQLQNWGQVLQVPPLSAKGTTMEIAALFGGPAEMRTAVERMTGLLYGAGGSNV
jgi:type I restriction enzyme, R subunit